jgi:hypothetical protein
VIGVESRTARQKFRDTALRRGKAGLPRFEAMGFWEETIARWHEEGLPAGVSPFDYFQLDKFMDNAPQGIAYHTDQVIAPAYWPQSEVEVLEETAEYTVSRQKDGIVVKQLKGTTSMPLFLGFPVRSERDWDAVKERLDPKVAERYIGVEEVARKVKGRAYILRFGVCGVYGFLRSLLGPENLCYALYDSPKFIRRLLDHWLYFNITLADRLCPLIDFDYVFLWEDMAFKTGPLMSPKHFRHFILPCYNELIGHLKKRYGFDLFMVDSDGNNWDLLPLFIEGGVNILLPLEIAAGMEPLEIRRHFPQLALIGGIDKRALLYGEVAIRQEIERKVPALIEQGGYFPSIDHHVPSDIRFESFCRYIEILREYL